MEKRDNKNNKKLMKAKRFLNVVSLIVMLLASIYVGYSLKPSGKVNGTFFHRNVAEIGDIYKEEVQEQNGVVASKVKLDGDSIIVTIDFDDSMEYEKAYLTVTEDNIKIEYVTNKKLDKEQWKRYLSGEIKELKEMLIDE